MPAMVLTMIGKMEPRKTTATFEAMPMPSQITMIGSRISVGAM